MKCAPSRSCLHLAARAGQAASLRALLEDLDEEERIAFLNDPDKNGITPVFLAKQKGVCVLTIPRIAARRPSKALLERRAYSRIQMQQSSASC